MQARTGLVGLFTGALLVIAPGPAGAYKFFPDRYRPIPSGKVRYYDASSYPWAVTRAAAIWNRSGVRVHFSPSSRRRANLIIRTSGPRPRADAILKNGCSGIAFGRRPQALIRMASGCFDGLVLATGITHEMGHILGLLHETRSCAVMNPTYFGFAPSLC